jgi:hypothetical protein
MKRIYTLLLLLASIGFLHAQDAAPVPEVLQMKETAFNFGTIPQGKPVYHFFEVINMGKEPLKIDNVQTSCGCTTPEWSREPIAPGVTTMVKVGYNAAAEGTFEKSITIQYNQSQAKHVKISGTVWKAPQGSAPVNASIQLLKQQNN